MGTSGIVQWFPSTFRSEIAEYFMSPIKSTGASDDKFWESALSLYSKRLELLSSNIANADTPHYKARDLDFRAAMSHAMSQAEPLAAQSNPTHDVFSNNRALPLVHRIAAQPSADANTVDMDVERAAFADTAIRYELAVKKVAHEYKEMSELLKSVTY